MRHKPRMLPITISTFVLAALTTSLVNAEVITTHELTGKQKDGAEVKLGKIEYELTDISATLGMPLGDLKTLAKEYFGISLPKLKLTLEGNGDKEKRYFKEKPKAKIKVTFGDLNLSNKGVATKIGSQVTNLSLGKVSACDLILKGNPIHIGTGNKFQREPQFQYQSPGKSFGFDLFYNSQLNQPTTLGKGWSHNFNITGEFNFDAGWAGIRRGDGKWLEFVADEQGVWQNIDDSNNKLEWTSNSVTWVSGNTRYQFNEFGQLKRIENTRGLGQTLSYSPSVKDKAGKLVRITDDFGGVITFNYDKQYRINEVIDMAGQSYRYTYDKHNNLVRIARPDNTTRQYRYEDPRFPNHLTGIIDGENRRYATFAYDDKGRAILSQHGVKPNITDKTEVVYTNSAKRLINGHEYTLGFKNYQWTVTQVKMEADKGKAGSCGITKRTFYPDGKLAATTDANGIETNYTDYDRWGRPGTVTRFPKTAHQRHTQYRYHPVVDRPIQIIRTAPNGEQTTDLRYDSQGNLIELSQHGLTPDKQPVLRKLRFAYDNIGHPIKLDGPREDINDITTLTYYPNTPEKGFNQGRLQSITDATGLTTTVLAYNAFGQATRTQLPTGVVQENRYDKRNRLITRTTAANNQQRLTLYAYDKAGLPKTITQPDGKVMTLAYNSARKLVALTDHRQTKISLSYDERGNVTKQTLTDKNGKVLQQTKTNYDLRDLPQSITDALGNTLRYTYDVGQRLTAITDARGNKTTMQYNTLGQISAINAPLNQRTQFGYDKLDNLNKVIDPIGVPTTFKHDDLGRTLEESSKDRGKLTYQQNLASQLTQQTDAQQRKTQYHYDASGRLSNITYSEQDTVQLSYDDKGRLATIQESWGTLATDYTAFNQTKTLTQTVNNGSAFTQHYAYDTSGRITQHTLPSGKTIHYQYKNGDLVSITLDKQAILNNMNTHGTGQLQSATYGNGLPYRHTFDKAGRTIQQQRGTQSIAYRYDKNGNITQQGNTTYDYDKLNRLRSANDPQFKQITYRYDANGNRTTLKTKNDKTTYQYKTGTNQLVGINQQTIHYDNTGRRIDDGRFTYAYNARGRIETITNKKTNNTTSYQYRMDGLRVSKTTHNKTTFYVYSKDQQLIAEVNNQGDIEKEYVWLGLMPVAVIENDNVYYIHTDHLTTPRIATDKNKKIVWQWHSTPFGKGEPIEKGLTLNLRFPGQYFDEESRLHYNWWRYYEPGLGRYVTADPIGINKEANIYNYTAGNPAKNIDSHGLWSTQAHNALLTEFVNKIHGNKNPIFILGLFAGSRYADSITAGHQGPDFTFIHAMTSDSFDTPKKACQALTNFVKNGISDYQSKYDIATQLNQSDSIIDNAKGAAALYDSGYALGFALHPLMDSTSPAHANWAFWDSSILNMDVFHHGSFPTSKETLNVLASRPDLVQKSLELMEQALSGKSIFNCECLK